MEKEEGQKVQPGPWQIVDSTRHLQDIEIFDTPQPQQFSHVRNRQGKNSKRNITSSLYKIFNPQSNCHKNCSIGNRSNREIINKSHNSSKKLFHTKNIRINKDNTQSNVYTSSYKVIQAQRFWNQRVILNKKKTDKYITYPLKTQKSEQTISQSRAKKESSKNKESNSNATMMKMRMNSQKSHSLNTILFNSRIQFTGYVEKKQHQPQSCRITQNIKTAPKKDSNRLFTDSNLYKHKEKELIKRKANEQKEFKKPRRIFSIQEKWEFDKRHSNFKKFQKGCFEVFPGI